MFGLGPATKIYIAVESVDMRKGFDGLYGLVRDRLGEDPLSGHLFLFTNQAKSRLKALVGRQRAWAREAGKEPFPVAGGGMGGIVMRPEELAVLVNVDVAGRAIFVAKALAIIPHPTYNQLTR
jgi:transposase